METARAADRVAADNAVREMEMRLTAMIANMTRTAENFDVVAVKFQAEVPLVCPSPALVSRTGGRRVPGGGLRQLMPPSAEMCRAVWSGASNKVHLLVAGSPVQPLRRDESSSAPGTGRREVPRGSHRASRG